MLEVAEFLSLEGISSPATGDRAGILRLSCEGQGAEQQAPARS